MRYPKHYVVGFLFNDSATRLILINKNRPTWQKGHWNGVGGKIEPGESAAKAMTREAAEEIGVVMAWTEYVTLEYPEAVVTFFWAKSDFLFHTASAQTDEQIDRRYVSEWLGSQMPIPNLRFLIPMAVHAATLESMEPATIRMMGSGDLVATSKEPSHEAET